MGRMLNISQPAVINTELAPFTESFTITANDTTEQWYYDNTRDYMPDRTATPLTLSPQLSVSDGENSYYPEYYLVSWYVLEHNGSSWVETKISNIDDSSSADYVLSENSLIVKKNVSYSYGVTIRCVAQYIDPRDVGITYTVEGNIQLSTNRDASVMFPVIDILREESTPYNPLTMENSIFSFEARAYLGAEDITEEVYFVWYVVDENENIEKLAENTLAYVSGQGTKTLVLDAMYTERITVVLCAKENASSSKIYPDKKYRTLTWKIPDVDATVLSENGSSVRSEKGTMRFDTIVNVRHNTLSDEKKYENLAFDWRMRKSNVSSETDLGWGQNIEIPSENLKNIGGQGSSRTSTLVYPHVYLLSAYKQVINDDDEITYDGMKVVSRIIE